MQLPNGIGNSVYITNLAQLRKACSLLDFDKSVCAQKVGVLPEVNNRKSQ